MLEHHEAAYSSAYWTLAALGMALGSPATTPEPTPQPLVPSSSFDVSTALGTALDGVKTLDTALDGVKTLGGAIVSVIAELDFTPASHFVSELLGLERHTELE